MSELRPVDHVARQRALDPNQSFIVQAPAGSGKTGLLVRRFLTLLRHVNEPEEIVAITFTRKATAEMQQRILQALQDAQTQRPQNSEIKDLALSALKIDKQKKWDIVENPGRLRILTIDAFAYELVRHMPWTARFGSSPTILEDSAAGKLYRQAAHRTLDHLNFDNELTSHCANIFNLADAQFDKAQSLIASMLSKRDRWMRGLTFHSRENFERMWQQVIDQQLQSASDSLDGELKAEILQSLLFSAANCNGEKPDLEIANCLELTKFPNASSQELPQWRGVASLLLTTKGEFRKTVNKNNGFPTNCKEQKQRMLSLLEKLKDYSEVQQELSIISTLPTGQFSEEQWQTLESLLELLPIAAAELRLLFKESNQADYIEVTQRAEAALGEIDNPSDLALAADHKIKHILMDEVQDTSKAQIDLLKDLTRGWTRGDNRTVFFVGDPMQSIYRFREAEVGNFLQIQQSGIGQIQPEQLTLQSNFRSTASLVNWFNQTFIEIFPSKDDIINSAVSYSASISNSEYEEKSATDTPAMQFHPQWQVSPHQEGLNICQQIVKTHKDNPSFSIGVLGRSRKHLGEIANALRSNEIAYQAIELESLIHRQVILDLLSLSRAIIHLSDRIAWLSVLRAPWCGLDLKDLTMLTENSNGSTVFELIETELEQSSSNKYSLSQSGLKRLKRLHQAISPAVTQSGRQPLKDIIYATWFRLGGPDCIKPDEIQDCERFFDLLASLEQQRIPLNAESLHDATARRWSQTNIQANVQLLTIHKAKGLEFDVVILPMLNSKSRGDDREIMRWTRLSKQLLISVLPHSHAEDDRFYSYLGELEKRRQKNELCRLLYVACTRARRELHLFTNLKLDKNGNPGNPEPNSLWQLLAPTFNSAISPPTEINANTLSEESIPSNAKPFYRLHEDWKLQLKSVELSADSNMLSTIDTADESIEFSWAGETARISGIAIHHCLQHIETDDWLNWKTHNTENLASTSQTLLHYHGLSGVQFEQGLQNLHNAIDQVKLDSRADWLFSSAHNDIQAEWPLTAVLDGKITSIVIDRSFVDNDGTRWIIDFKSSRHDDPDLQQFLDNEQLRYQSQMQRYARILALTETRHTKLALYFPLHQGWREWTA